MSFKVRDALSGFGWLVAAGAFLIGNVTGDTAHPVDRIVPLSGGSEFSVEAFCREQRTAVRGAPAPDAIAEVYQLIQPQESVIWNSATDSAVHYYFVNGEQRSELVIVTQPAAACIEERVQ